MIMAERALKGTSHKVTGRITKIIAINHQQKQKPPQRGKKALHLHGRPSHEISAFGILPNPPARPSVRPSYTSAHHPIVRTL